MSDLEGLLGDAAVRLASEQRITWSYLSWLRALDQTELAPVVLPALDRVEDHWALDDHGITMGTKLLYFAAFDSDQPVLSASLARISSRKSCRLASAADCKLSAPLMPVSDSPPWRDIADIDQGC